MRRSGLFAKWIIALLCIAMVSCSVNENDAFSERVKISLRQVGNQLLLTDQDSTSLIHPVIDLGASKYSVSFQNQLAFQPNSLVSIVQDNFQKSGLPSYYRVEVIQCIDDEVAYSYEMSLEDENTIIPCAGRILPKSCYTIEVKFTNKASSYIEDMPIIIFGILISIVPFFIYGKRKTTKLSRKNYINIGSYKFYANQNKLIKESIEINLSKKECELLEIFVASPNQIIKRDELTKRVWEDNGVFVGRSLDTYISKLRKKLVDDSTIKLTNIHGVGYKLEIDKN